MSTKEKSKELYAIKKIANRKCPLRDEGLEKWWDFEGELLRNIELGESLLLRHDKYGVFYTSMVTAIYPHEGNKSNIDKVDLPPNFPDFNNINNIQIEHNDILFSTLNSIYLLRKK